ncbi:MAG: MFS transporter [Myxococcota bacterium]
MDAPSPRDPARPLEPVALGARRSALGVLGLPHFRALWSSSLLQFLAMQIHLFTLQWLVTELTASRTLLGLLIAIQGATVALFSPIGGVATDRFAKRSLLAGTRVSAAVLVLGLAALLHADRIALPILFAAAAFGGLISAMSQPATQAYVFDVVGSENTQPAVALNSAGIGLGQMAGPALAGVLIAGGGIVGSWTAAAAGLLLAAALLAAIPVRGRATGRRRAPWRELREGFAYVVAHPPVWLALLACAMAFFNGAIFAMRPVFARHVLGVGSEGMGVMAASAGLGTLLGAIVATALPDFRRPGLAIAFSMLAFSGCVLLYAFAFSYPYVLTVEFASGLAAQLWQISTFSGLQLAVPEHLRGRVVGMVFMVAQLAQVGGVFVGALADRVGDQVAMGVFGAIPMTLLIALITFGWGGLSRLGREAGPR